MDSQLKSDGLIERMTYYSSDDCVALRQPIGEIPPLSTKGDI